MTTNTENQLLRERALRLANLVGGDVAEVLRKLCAALTQPAQAGEAVLYVAPGQLADHTDPDAPCSGSYIPARRTPAGNFTQPLYTTPPASQEQSDTHVLLDALRKLSCLGNGDQPGNSDGNLIAQRALDAWASQEQCSGPLCGLPEFGGNCHPLCEKASQEQAQQPLAEHKKDCPTCAHRALPGYAPKCQQCNRLATGARRNWEAQQPSGGEVVGQITGFLSDVEALVQFRPHQGAPLKAGDTLTLATKPEPMTDEQASELAKVGPVYAPEGKVTRTPQQYRNELRDARVEGIRLAEGHHGITSTKEQA